MNENKKITALENEILRHKNHYYQGKPLISDYEYDQLEQELRQLNPESFVLEKIGSTYFKNEKIQHKKKMLSLAKTYDLQELNKWIGNHDVIALYKIDGSSLSLIYKNGRLQVGKTRGDGEYGEDVTNKCLFMSTIPKKIKIQSELEVRGEVYCEKENFEKLKKEMSQRQLEIPLSPRNIVAGILGRKDHVDLAKFLTFSAFDFICEEKEVTKEEKKFDLIQENNFKTQGYFKISNIEDIPQLINKTSSFMLEGDFLIDGLVFVYNNIQIQEELGETSHHPRYKIAFKFAGEVKKTKIIEILWQVSRNGILTPVAQVEPVELSGAVISRVTLHNWGVVRKNHLKIGDTIEIIRSGEVIPKFINVIESSLEAFEKPTKCPSCGCVVKEEDIRLFCHNENCPERKIDEIINFIKKIGIEDLSFKRVKDLFDKKIIQSIPDLYLLKSEDLINLDSYQEKLTNKILDNIAATKKISLLKLIMAMGISGGAKNKCEKIINSGINTIEKFKVLKLEELVKVEGFAEKSAKDFIDSLQQKMPIIEKLLDVGLEIDSGLEKNLESSKLDGQSFCITGALSRKRNDVENLIAENGGKVVGSVSKNLSYLVTNEIDSSSSKYKKALELKIPIINEESLMLMIGN